MTKAPGSARTRVREAARALWLMTAATSFMAGLVFLLNLGHYGIAGAAAGLGLVPAAVLLGLRAFRAPSGSDPGGDPPS